MKLSSCALLSLALLCSSCSLVSGPTAAGPAAPGAATPSPEDSIRIPVQETPPADLPARGERGETPLRIPGRAWAPLPLADDVRALWVVRTTLTHPDSIRVMVERAADAGFNTLLVQVRGRGDAYYQSRWEPRPESVLEHGSSFDPLALVIQEAHARGLGVHAWVNAHLVGGIGNLPSDPLHLIRVRPDLLAVPRVLARELYRVEPQDPRFAEALLRYAQDNRDVIEGIYTAPSHPEVKEHLYSVWMDLVDSYDLDGLHFDYVRYPNPDFDYSSGALDRFRAWVDPRLSPARRGEIEEAFRSDPLAYVEALPGPWGEFRRAQITELVERIYFGVKKRSPNLVVSAAVFANADDAYETRFQDWRGWVQQGILDAVAPMAYTADNGQFESQIRAAVEAAGRDRVWAGVGIYQNTYQGTLDKIRTADRLGTRGVVLFSYDWAVSQGETDAGRSFLDRIGIDAFRRR
jgi:uncharacterized lipoprotein YddW (UPF0748 family)